MAAARMMTVQTLACRMAPLFDTLPEFASQTLEVGLLDQERRTLVARGLGRRIERYGAMNGAR